MNTTNPSPRLLSAIEMAVRVHGPMKRKGDDKPYLIHPIAVYGLLTQWGADEDTRITGLLHDVIEDAEDDQIRAEYRKEIEDKFGKGVLDTVEGVTEQDKSLPWKERKKLYLEHLKVASKESLMVSCADRTHNILSLVESYKNKGEEVWKRFNAPKPWQVWFIDQVATILKERLDKKYTADLRTSILELNDLLSQSIPSQYRSVASVVTDKDGNVQVNRDPLYLELRDHCMLSEGELESGILEDTQTAIGNMPEGERRGDNIEPTESHDSSPLMAMLPLEQAISIALAAHTGQVDKAGAPYILHPLRVMQKMPSGELMIIAVLHDVAEDSSITFEYLRQKGFSDTVISAVEALTKHDGEKYEDFIQRAKTNPLARSVKIADIEDNLDIGRIAHPTSKDYERLEKYKKALLLLNNYPLQNEHHCITKSMNQESSKGKEAYILVIAILIAIAFMETSVGPIWTADYWKEFLLKLVIYGATAVFVLIFLSVFHKRNP